MRQYLNAACLIGITNINSICGLTPEGVGVISPHFRIARLQIIVKSAPTSTDIARAPTLNFVEDQLLLVLLGSDSIRGLFRAPDRA